MKRLFAIGPPAKKEESDGNQVKSGQEAVTIPAGKLRLTPGWGYVVSASALGVSLNRLPAALVTEEFVGNGYAFRLFQRTGEGSGVYLQEMGSTVLTVVKE